jgi:hypothetical protein
VSELADAEKEMLALDVRIEVVTEQMKAKELEAIQLRKTLTDLKKQRLDAYSRVIKLKVRDPSKKDGTL